MIKDNYKKLAKKVYFKMKYFLVKLYKFEKVKFRLNIQTLIYKIYKYWQIRHNNFFIKST